LTSKNKRLNVGSGKNGLKTTGGITPDAYFRGLGIRQKGPQEIGAELRKQLKRGLYRDMQKAASQFDANQSRRLIGSDLKALKITSCGSFDEIMAKARLATRMPIQEKSYILDLGMDKAVPVALWRAEYHESWVRSVSPYWQAGAQWAQQIGERRVTFMDNNLQSLLEADKRPYDAVILSPGWGHILGGNLGKATIPQSSCFQNVKETDPRLIALFGFFQDVLTPEGILILEMDFVSSADLAGSAIEASLHGIFPNWKLAMSLVPLDGQDREYGLIFSRENIPLFVQKALAVLREQGKIAAGCGYYGDSTPLFHHYFQDGDLAVLCEYEWVKDKVRDQVEFIKKGEMGLCYRSSSQGYHGAGLVSLDQFSMEVERLKTNLENKEAQQEIRIINKFLA
jgi:hypothetical protein